MKLLEQEAELVQRLYARDEQAMTLFYQKYHKALYHFIWDIVRHNELAEEVLQESMLKVWFSFAKYDARKGRLFTWALQVSRNLALDQLRNARYKQAKRTLPLLETEEQPFIANCSFKPEHIGVRDWVAALPTNDRYLMETLYFEGYTQAEASEHLQIPLGTVKSRVKRIVTQLARNVN
ncbi:MAG: sigma-70 family RNA polymerase sigma factor [Hymenobacter sp.]|nr:MAG: sigma-70 family RNA polymerase sigma factor [Hymenobacter sp.]